MSEPAPEIRIDVPLVGAAVWGVVRAGERETAGRPREARTIVMGSGEDETGVARHTGTERARCLNSIMVFVFVLTT